MSLRGHTDITIGQLTREVEKTKVKNVFRWKELRLRLLYDGPLRDRLIGPSLRPPARMPPTLRLCISLASRFCQAVAVSQHLSGSSGIRGLLSWADEGRGRHRLRVLQMTRRGASSIHTRAKSRKCGIVAN